MVDRAEPGVTPLTERLARLLANAHYDLVAPILSEDEYDRMAERLIGAGVTLDAATPRPGLVEALDAAIRSVWEEGHPDLGGLTTDPEDATLAAAIERALAR